MDQESVVLFPDANLAAPDFHPAWVSQLAGGTTATQAVFAEEQAAVQEDLEKL